MFRTKLQDEVIEVYPKSNGHWLDDMRLKFVYDIPTDNAAHSCVRTVIDRVRLNPPEGYAVHDGTLAVGGHLIVDSATYADGVVTFLGSPTTIGPRYSAEVAIVLRRDTPHDDSYLDLEMPILVNSTFQMVYHPLLGWM